MALRFQTRRFDVDEYHRMAAAGILRREDRVELIDGEIVEMTPIGRRHRGAVDYLNRRLVQGCGDRAIVRVQGAIRLSRHSEPEPDYDRGVKAILRVGIPEVWVVDLPGERVEVCRGPSPEGYRAVQSRGRGEQVAPAAFPHLAIPVGEILG